MSDLLPTAAFLLGASSTCLLPHEHARPRPLLRDVGHLDDYSSRSRLDLAFSRLTLGNLSTSAFNLKYP